MFHCLLNRKHGALSQEEAYPLSESCGCQRLKVCRINGDRAVCSKMAQLGVLPGTVLEPLCSGRGHKQRQCMVKINGSTLSLDELTAAHIFVKPA